MHQYKSAGKVGTLSYAHVRKFDEARKAQSAQNAAGGQARAPLEMIRELYLVERALWDRNQPITPEHRVRVRAELRADRCKVPRLV